MPDYIIVRFDLKLKLGAKNGVEIFLRYLGILKLTKDDKKVKTTQLAS